ncbi:MAG: hypothetical protein QOJ92_1405 [Frankiales bacterium]|nr:hypothetical protein [Frankiales bacterium]
MNPMRRIALAAAVAVLATPLAASAHGDRHDPPRAIPAMAVVAIVDSGINPYSVQFRDTSKLAYKHPSTYIPGFPKSAQALRLHLNLPYAQALKADAAVWATVAPKELYWIPGTRIVGAISMGAGGTLCPTTVKAPPASTAFAGDCTEHRILDDLGHGTMTASRVGGAKHSLAPTARIVEVEGLGAGSLDWVTAQPWIDVTSNSWLSLAPQPAGKTGFDSTTAAFARAAKRLLTVAASGNGAAFAEGVAPTPTYALSTGAPGVVLVGGHDNGHVTAWSGAPPHVVADAYGGWTGISNSSTVVRPDPIACCTSAAAPYVAGAAAQIVQEAREMLGATGTGVRGGIVAKGKRGLVKRGPLADGVLTLDELRTLLLRTADPRPKAGPDDGLLHWMGGPRAPDNTEYGVGGNPFCAGCTTLPAEWSSVPAAVDQYAQIGYGNIDAETVDHAVDVMSGEKAMPSRPTEDADYALDQQARAALS